MAAARLLTSARCRERGMFSQLNANLPALRLFSVVLMHTYAKTRIAKAMNGTTVMNKSEGVVQLERSFMCQWLKAVCCQLRGRGHSQTCQVRKGLHPPSGTPPTRRYKGMSRYKIHAT